MGHKRISEFENSIKTKMGAAFGGDRVVYRGHDLHHELGDMDWMEFYVFGITGKRFSKPIIELLNYFWVCTSYPDPRIWNNRIVSLASASRATGTQALSAGLMTSEADIYGHRLSVKAVDFYQRLIVAVEQGEDVETFVKNEMTAKRVIPGYGRPMATGDERVPAALRKIKSLGLDNGRCYELCLDVEKVVKKKWRMSMNIVSLGAAKIADFGFTPTQYLMFMYPCHLAGMTMGYIEALESPEGGSFPIRCSSLVTVGKHPEKRWNGSAD